MIGQSQKPDNTQHSHETHIPPEGFELEIPASDRPEILDSDSSATGIA